ncbi:MAG: TonB-dependent receptor, partial [Gammaproteobacteria bacterium]|nr:TonB-dependent receptor [Gammaproteobacteria bacterium]
TSRNNKSVFIQYQGKVSTHDLQIAVRKDDNEQFGSENTGSIAWGKELESGLMLTANYGTAFKAPTFNDLYFPADSFSASNPDLIPEESASYEVGLGAKRNGTAWSLNLYETNIENLIVWVEEPAWFWSPVNIGEAQIRGLEASLSTQLSSWQLNTNLSLLDPKNISDDANSGNQLPRRAKQTLSFDASKQYGEFKVGATVLAVGKRFDDLANTTELDSYNTIGLHIDYSVAKDWLLQGKVENLGDEEYQTAEGYNQAGRNFFITLRYQP